MENEIKIAGEIILFIVYLGTSLLAQYPYLEDSTVVDGAITGVIIGAARAVTYFTIERTILNTCIDWLIVISTGLALGGVYEWLGGKSKSRRYTRSIWSMGFTSLTQYSQRGTYLEYGYKFRRRHVEVTQAG